MRKFEDHPPIPGAKETTTPSATLKAVAGASPALTKLMLVDFRNGEAVDRHPDLAPFLQDGWTIRSAMPRIVETEGTRLFVVLQPPAAKPVLE